MCIDRGAWSTVTLEEGEGRIDIQINGETATAPVTKLAIHQIIRGLELDAVVETTLDLPVGQGFGMSAAGSLSACVAAREVLDIMGVEASVPEPLFCTHVAEVKMMTGMGDAVAQSMGGIVAREKAGIPPFGEAKKELSKEKIVVCIVGEPLPTQDILADSDRIADISDAASSLVPVFAEHLSLDVLVELSRRFVKKTDLMSPEVMAALEEVDKIGRGSMIILG
ncbi:MAG: hypothetical protein KAT70_04325, partial [Thermoplasmata archaeon]|nr:hypothetical protein [Thermoplasmata archaeon]